MRKSRPIPLPLLIAVLFVSGCESPQTIETEMRLAELENYALELETQLEYVYNEISQLSRSLSSDVTNVERALSDVHLRVLDLPSGELIITMREVEAAVAVANQRVAELRRTTNDLAGMVDY
jgi:hypothetical protein